MLTSSFAIKFEAIMFVSFCEFMLMFPPIRFEDVFTSLCVSTVSVSFLPRNPPSFSCFA